MTVRWERLGDKVELDANHGETLNDAYRRVLSTAFEGLSNSCPSFVKPSDGYSKGLGARLAQLDMEFDLLDRILGVVFFCCLIGSFLVLFVTQGWISYQATGQLLRQFPLEKCWPGWLLIGVLINAFCTAFLLASAPEIELLKNRHHKPHDAAWVLLLLSLASPVVLLLASGMVLTVFLDCPGHPLFYLALSNTLLFVQFFAAVLPWGVLVAIALRPLHRLGVRSIWANPDWIVRSLLETIADLECLPRSAPWDTKQRVMTKVVKTAWQMNAFANLESREGGAWAAARMKLAARHFQEMAAWLAVPKRDTETQVRERCAMHLKAYTDLAFAELPGGSGELPTCQAPAKRSMLAVIRSLCGVFCVAALPPIGAGLIGLWLKVDVPDGIKPLLFSAAAFWMGACLLVHFDRVSPEARDFLTKLLVRSKS